MKRPPITKKLRFAVLSRDGFACRYCGAESPKAKLVLDHIIPVARGGQMDIANLVTSCQPCNAGKSDRPLNGAPSVSEIQQRAAALLATQEESAKSIRRAMRRQKTARKDVIDFWCSLTFRDSVCGSTISVMVNYVEQFGADVVFGWIQKAADKCGYSDQRMGRYVSGIRRKALEEGWKK